MIVKELDVVKENKDNSSTFNAAMEAIRLMKKKQADATVSAKVNFAGQSYQVQRQATA
jgi:hypothetical protein